MRTNIELDDKLIKEALKLSDVKTKKGVIHQALILYVEIKKKKNLKDLKGKISFHPDYDHKKMRAG